MDPRLFLADLEAKPAVLAGLASAADPFASLPAHVEHVLLLGMGSSRYAASVAAHRMRCAGIDALAEYASARPHPLRPGTLVVAISATGGSAETLDAVSAYAGRAPIVAMTNVPGSAICSQADVVVPMLAGEERGGVACRTYQHTLVLLLALTAHLTGGALGDLALRAADACDDLLTRRGEWLDRVIEALDGPDGVYALAPAERLASAQQAALMFREGPRRAATGCETGDWAHVDVYLTKTLDYRALLFTGSRYDEQAIDWLRQRASTVVAVGADRPGAAVTVRYRGDDDPDVALLTEVPVAELVAATWWSP
ncbi:MAG TPA: SIS domain-containing protein [Micromonosporaceae bacterium]|jgi:fructoselysine-6-P-deglycase FrlB-like protein